MDRPPHGLIATKLMLPAGPRHYVHRARLDRMLATGTRRRLTLVAAPAGYGKTTLVTSWLAAAKSGPVGWLSLERKDNDPARFWAYLQAALLALGVDTIDDFGIELAGMDSPEAALGSLINTLAAQTEDCVLVLDDYHEITEPAIHAGIAFLIAALPPQFHLVILSRSDPPFALLSRWTANGEIVEIRARDLAFNRDETDLFLSDNGVELPADLAAALVGRLAGWVAALRLVANWIAGRADPAGAVAQFAASDSTIAAYLTTEVLDQLPAEVRQFLLATSILPRLSGPLCDAVTATTTGAESLAYLYDRDLFLDALDGDRVWFGYHQLFAELLSHQLRREQPDAIAELRRRAADWYAANGFATEAIEQCLASQDWDRVKLLMLDEALSIGAQSSPAVVGGWLAQVPAAELATPFFLMLQAFVALHAGAVTDGKRALERGFALLPAGTAAGHPPEMPELPALLHVLAAGIARLDCDLDAATTAAAAVKAELAAVGAMSSPVGKMAIAAADNSLLGTAYWHGDLASSAQLIGDGGETAPELVRMRINRMSLAASALADAGQLRQADAAIAAVLEVARDAGLNTMFQTNPAHLAAGLVSLQRADPDRAREQLTIVWDRARRHGDRAPATVAGVLLARLSALTGDAATALRVLDAAKTAWPGWQPPHTLTAMIAEEEARLCIAVGDLAAARAVLARLQALPGESARRDFSIRLTAARLRLADGDTAGAPEFIACANLALRNGRLSRGIEALVEAAVASRAAGHPAQAQVSLERALALAEHETIAAPFVWHSVAIRPLLLAMELGGAEVAMLGFRQRLLDTMGVPTQRSAAGVVVPAQPEQLSDRELTVLRLLRGSLTNPEIAAALEISPNTLKTHLRHIYGKLGAANRQVALDRARELDLL